MRRSKKGQAAMEFLMTYGWAILVVLVAIAALAYFGVLRPSRFLPSSCTLGAGFSCDDFKVTSGGVGTFSVRNGIGTNIYNVTLTVEGQTCTPSNTSIHNGEKVTFTCNGLTSGTVGGKYSADITLSYRQEDSDIVHDINGKVTTKYE